MEGLNPVIKLIWYVKKSIEQGSSVRMGIKKYLRAEDDPWKTSVETWLIHLERGISTHPTVQNQKSPYRRQLLLILERGLKGESIMTNLTQLEKETLERVELDLEAYISKIPYILLIPLSLFLFPACLILMLGPFVFELMHAL